MNNNNKETVLDKSM